MRFCGFVATLILISAALAANPSVAFSTELDCLIEPYLTVTLATPEVGLLEAVLVDRGDRIEKGQVVAKLDSTVEGAIGAVNYARAKMSNERLAELELRRTTAELGRRTIRSPITGVVLERMLSPGEFAKQDPILKIAQLDPLRVEAFVPVSLLGKIRVGMTAEVVPEAPLNRGHPAKVTIVDSVVDAASGTFGVRLELPNPEYRLPAGLKCRVRFNKANQSRP